MGRKSQSKQMSKKNGSRENNKFAQQKRKELAILVDKVLRLTSIFQASNVTKSWEHHLEIEAIVKEIINLEVPQQKSYHKPRKLCIENYVEWLNENGVQFQGKVKIG